MQIGVLLAGLNGRRFLMYRTTSVLALGLFLGFAPIGALAQTQTDDTDTQQLTQPSDSEQSTDTMKSDDQQSTETKTLEADEEETTETKTLETDEQETTETEVLETDEQETTETEALDTDEQETTETDTMDTDKADTAAGGEEVIPEQEATEMLASSLMGAEVHLADESIGTVSDIIIGEDHMVKGVVVGVGGFLGIGEKRVALPMEKITIQPTEEVGEVELSTSNTREELEAFEEFKTASDVQAEEEAAQSQQQMQSQQPAAPTQPAAPQQ
jgi:hypothetical protein